MMQYKRLYGEVSHEVQVSEVDFALYIVSQLVTQYNSGEPDIVLYPRLQPGTGLPDRKTPRE